VLPLNTSRASSRAIASLLYSLSARLRFVAGFSDSRSQCVGLNLVDLAGAIGLLDLMGIIACLRGIGALPDARAQPLKLHLAIEMLALPIFVAGQH
jgi:hypothetical protein